jgi:hypothetical protein
MPADTDHRRLLCSPSPLPVFLHLSLLRELDGGAREESARHLVANEPGERAWPVKRGVLGISGRSRSAMEVGCASDFSAEHGEVGRV